MVNIRDFNFIQYFTGRVFYLNSRIKNNWLNIKRMSHSLKEFRGIILVELMMAIFIFILLSGVMFAILATGRNAWEIGDARIELQQELRKGMDAITEELRQAGISTIVGVPADGNWYNTVTFQIPDDVIGGSISWSETIQYLLGGLNTRQLLRRSKGEDRVLANNIVYLGIRRQAANPYIVEVSLRADKTTTRGNLIDVNLNFQVRLRN